MKKYEAIIILNPNLSSKVENFIKDFEKLLKANTFVVKKIEDIGRRQLSYSINNHNKGHYLFFNIEGNALNLIDIENKIKYDESIIRHLFISESGGSVYPGPHTSNLSLYPSPSLPFLSKNT